MKRLTPFLICGGALALGGVACGAYVWHQSDPETRRERLEGELAILSRLERPQQRREVLRELLELDPSHVGVRLRLAEAQRRTGELDAAAQTLREGIEQGEDAQLRLALAGIYESQRRYRDALELLSSVEEGDVQDAAARSALALSRGRLAARLGRYDEAEAQLRRCVELRESHGLRKLATGDARVRGLAALGDLLRAMGRYPEAQEVLSQANEEAPGALRVGIGLAETLQRLGRAEEAEAVLSRLADQNESRRDQVIPALASAYLRRGALQQAHELVERERERGSVANAAHVRGLVALHEGRLDDARGAFGELCEQRPDAGWRLLARLERRAGREDAERAALESWLERAPHALPPRLRLLTLAQRAGDSEQARRRALALIEVPSARWRALSVLLATRPEPAVLERVRARLAEVQQGEGDPEPALRLQLAAVDLSLGQPERALPTLQELGQDERLERALALFGAAAEARHDLHGVLQQLADLAEEHPKLGRLQLTLARVFRRLGLNDLAERHARLALLGEGELEGVRLLLAELAASEGNLAGAEQLLRELRQQRPQDQRALAALANVQLRRGDAAGAAETLREAVRLAPEAALAHAHLGRALLLSGDALGAREAFRAARRCDPALPASYLGGLTWLLEGRWERGIEELRAGLQASGSPRLRAALAAALLAEGQAEQALQLVQRRRLPWRAASAGVFETRRRALKGDAAEAARGAGALGLDAELAEAAQASSSREGERELWLLLALEAAEWRDVADQRLAALGEDAAPLTLWWGASAASDPQQRLRLGELLRARAPESLAARRLAAGAALAADDLKRASELLEPLASDDSPRSLELRARLAERRGEVPQAIDLYRAALAAGRESPLVLNNLACLLRQPPGQGEAALEHARRAVQLAPRSAALRDTQGQVLMALERPDAAIDAFAAALALEPTKTTSRLHLAEALLEAGETERARGNLELAMLDAELAQSPAAQRLRARLKDTP